MIDLDDCLRPLRFSVEELLACSLTQRLASDIRPIASLLALILDSKERYSMGLSDFLSGISDNLAEISRQQDQHFVETSQQLMNNERKRQQQPQSSAKKFQNSQKQCEIELSNACSCFLSNLSTISTRLSQMEISENQKQNNEQQKEIFLKESLMNEITNLRNKITDYMAILAQSGRAQENISKIESGSMKNQNNQKSSVRSLLTQKLKQIQIEYNEEDLGNSTQQLAIKGNWILREMKTNVKNNQSACPNNIANMSEPDYDNGYRSLQVSEPKGNQKSERKRFQSHRTILGQINFQESERRESKVKEKESGCARCEIY